MIDLAIMNGRIVTSVGIYRTGLGIDKGKIVCLAKDQHLPPAKETIDIRELLILPGIIDIHTHFKDLGCSDWEDFSTGTRAGAAGGVTTIMEMPQTLPACTNKETFELKKKAVQQKAVINMALYGAGGIKNVANILELAEAGVVGYKAIFASCRTNSEKEELELSKMRTKELGNLLINDDEGFLEVLDRISETHLPCCVHAESADICNYYRKKLQRGRGNLYSFLMSRPAVAEVEAVSRTILLANQAGVQPHICHLSSRETVTAIRQAKILNKKVTSETCTHYLKFTVDDLKKHGPYGKVTPPIRRHNDREELWKGLLDGTIDVICSDHAPFSNKLKESGWDNIWEAPAGIAGIEVMLPVMLTFVNKGKISLEMLVRVMSENPAKIFGLFPSRGTISIGSFADLTIVDMKKKIKLNVEKFYSKAKSSAMVYDGLRVHGIPVFTIVNGKIVMKAGEVIGKNGGGLLVKPSQPRM